MFRVCFGSWEVDEILLTTCETLNEAIQTARELYAEKCGMDEWTFITDESGEIIDF